MANIHGSVQPVGYVPGERIKVTQADNANLITAIKMSALKRHYNFHVGSHIYVAFISVCKKGGRWPPNSNDYLYNCII